MHLLCQTLIQKALANLQVVTANQRLLSSRKAQRSTSTRRQDKTETPARSQPDGICAFHCKLIVLTIYDESAVDRHPDKFNMAVA